MIRLDGNSRLGVDRQEGPAARRGARRPGQGRGAPPRSAALCPPRPSARLPAPAHQRGVGLDVEDLSTPRSHRVARVRRKGGRHRDVVLALRTASALDEHLAAPGGALGVRAAAADRRRPAPRPLRGREGGRPPGHGRGDRPCRLPALPAPSLRHRSPRRRGGPAPRPGRCWAPRSADDPPRRPGPGGPRQTTPPTWSAPTSPDGGGRPGRGLARADPRSSGHLGRGPDTRAPGLYARQRR
jgi:hypothetical protein